jgi:hypothetical protein
MKKNRKIGLLFVIIISLTACGSTGSPTGGKKDTINPEIITISPDPFGNISGRDIEVTFSKPIEKNTIITGLSIYPPILHKKYYWDSNILTIRIQEELDDSTNYFFHFNKNIKCTHNNSLDKEYDYVFHTGKLNDYFVEGFFEYEKGEDYGSEVVLNIYSADSTFIKRELERAYYFKVEDLNPGNYEIRAFIDKNNNAKFEQSSEPFAREYFVYNLTEKPTLSLSYQDTTKPKIQAYKIINNREIHLEFSEEILQPENVTIFQDSTDVELHVIASSFGGNSMKMLVEKQDTLSYVLNFPKMEDLKGNFYENYKLKFSGRTIVDSIAPVLLNSIPQTGSIIEDQLPIITIEYSEIILAENFLSKLWEVESGKEIEISILKANSDVIQLQPKEKLRNLSSYKLELKSFDLNKNNTKSEILFIVIVRD